jgi:hypothetical protein
MKHIFKLILSGLLAILLVTGCDTEALHDLNKNPNSVGQIDVNYFFTTLALGITNGGSRGDNRYIDWRTNIGMCAHCTQQMATLAEGGLGLGDKYIDNDQEVSNAPFEFWIPDVGKKCHEILKQTGPGGYEEGLKVNMRNATRIIHAFNFARLSDMYGSVPYSEANQGLEGIYYPKYDKQKDVYVGCLQELEEATAALSAALPDDGFAFADVIYNGDVEKWRKWGYSLMLRLAMRVSNVDPVLAGPYITKALQGGVFESNDDNVWVPMATGPDVWTVQNGISRAFLPQDGGQGNDSHMAKTLIDWLMGPNKASVADDDPRLMIYTMGIGIWTGAGFAPIAGGTDPLNQKGMPSGKNQSMLDVDAGSHVVVDQTFSKINAVLLRLDSPHRLMTYSETELLQAEAIERGIGTVPGTALEHFENGVRAAMQMWVNYDPSLVVSDAQVDTYLATYPYGTYKPALEMIGEQLWASHFMNWYEAWSEYRRTGYPNLTPTNFPGNDTNGQIPGKLRLPSSEVSGNPNYATTATMPDEIKTKVWWAGGAE